jgi:hypothetical protein
VILSVKKRLKIGDYLTKQQIRLRDMQQSAESDFRIRALPHESVDPEALFDEKNQRSKNRETVP